MPHMLCPAVNDIFMRKKCNIRIKEHIFRQVTKYDKRAFCLPCRGKLFRSNESELQCIRCRILVHRNCYNELQEKCLGLKFHDPIKRCDMFPRIISSPLITSTAEVSIPTTTAAFSDNQPEATPENNTAVTVTTTTKSYSLDDFKLLKVIGRGTYGKVMMASLKETNQIYALKAIEKCTVKRAADLKWAYTERSVYLRIAKHPFLVGLHSCFQTTTHIVFAIDFVRCGDLVTVLERSKKIGYSEVRFYAAEISLGLNYLHEIGIIHRDLKPDNILLDHEGHIKIADYGLAKCNIGKEERTWTFCGTTVFMAPEVIRGCGYTHAVDWWALGVLIYEMLTGSNPFEVFQEDDDVDTDEAIYRRIVTKSSLSYGWWMTSDSVDVIEKFLQVDPSKRLGCQQPGGFDELKKHHFFNVFNFDKLYRRSVTPPMIPRLEDELDVSNFSSSFTDQAPVLETDFPYETEDINQNLFDGFDCINACYT